MKHISFNSRSTNWKKKLFIGFTALVALTFAVASGYYYAGEDCSCDCYTLERENVTLAKELAEEKQKNYDIKHGNNIFVDRPSFETLDSTLTIEIFKLAKELQHDSVTTNTLIKYGQATGKKAIVQSILKK